VTKRWNLGTSSIKSRHVHTLTSKISSSCFKHTGAVGVQASVTIATHQSVVSGMCVFGEGRPQKYFKITSKSESDLTLTNYNLPNIFKPTEVVIKSKCIHTSINYINYYACEDWFRSSCYRSLVVT
jgi:hypothetical protein